MAPVSKPRPRRNSHKRQTKITRYFHLRKPLRKPSYPVKGIKPADVPPLRIPACQPFSQWVDANIDISSATVVIGRGTYGIAYSILQPKSCVPVVLKLISMPTSSKVDEPLLYHHDLENGLMEALILQRVRSVKGIVTLRDTAIVYGSLPEKLLNPTIDFYRKLSSLQDKERVSCLVRSSRWLLLVTDHAGGKFPRQLAGAHAILILGQLAQTLSEAEKLGFEHRDLSTNNICVKWAPNPNLEGTAIPVATIIDMGFARCSGSDGRVYFHDLSTMGFATGQTKTLRNEQRVGQDGIESVEAEGALNQAGATTVGLEEINEPCYPTHARIAKIINEKHGGRWECFEPFSNALFLRSIAIRVRSSLMEDDLGSLPDSFLSLFIDKCTEAHNGAADVVDLFRQAPSC